MVVPVTVILATAPTPSEEPICCPSRWYSFEFNLVASTSEPRRLSMVHTLSNLDGSAMKNWFAFVGCLTMDVSGRVRCSIQASTSRFVSTPSCADGRAVEEYETVSRYEVPATLPVSNG